MTQRHGAHDRYRCPAPEMVTREVPKPERGPFASHLSLSPGY
jgi:hypothetical protein